MTGKKLQVEDVKSEDFIREYKDKLQQDPGNHDVTEELVTVGGIVRTNWDDRGDAYVNDLVGLSLRDLKSSVQEALK